MSETFALVHSFMVGRHKVTCSIPKGVPDQVVPYFVEWDPAPPPAELTPKERMQLRMGAMRLLGEVQRVTGMKVSVTTDRPTKVI